MSARELYATNDTFREVADLLFGAGYDEIVAKANPDMSDLATKAAKKKKESAERTQARIGLGSNVVGLAAGVAGTKDAYAGFKASRDPRSSYRGKHSLDLGGPRHGKVTRLRALGGGMKPSTKVLAAGALGLQVGNIAGDAIANRVLARAAKKKDIHKRLVPIKKSDQLDIKWEGEISKIDNDKQQVFGWASIVEMNGEPVVDLQGDYISIDEVEKSAYDYVHKSRKGGDMHLRDGDEPVHASDMIESFVVTPEKKQALGLPEETPTGWWVGYQVNDPGVWAKVKNGERTGFSIHGRGMRTPA